MIYPWLIKYAIQLGGIVVVLFILYAYGNHSGRAHVQALWDADKAAKLIDSSNAVRQRVAENQAAWNQSQQDNKKLKADYETKIAALNKRQHGGLYIGKAACGSLTLPAPSATPRGTDDPTTSIRLPRSVEQDLRDLAGDANVCAVRLRELQGWVAAAGC